MLGFHSSSKMSISEYQFSVPVGGLFLDSSVPSSFLSSVSFENSSNSSADLSRCGKAVDLRVLGGFSGMFLSVSLSVKGNEGLPKDSTGVFGRNAEKFVVGEGKKEKNVESRRAGGGVMNTTRHLWAGAIAAMVSRFYLLLDVLPF